MLIMLVSETLLTSQYQELKMNV